MFLSLVHTVFPFAICCVKNVAYVFHTLRYRVFKGIKTTCADVQVGNNIQNIRNVLLSLCLRFAIFSVPSMLIFILKHTTPYLYMRGANSSLGSMICDTYLPTVAKAFVTINYSINLLVFLLIKKEFRTKCCRPRSQSK